MPVIHVNVWEGFGPQKAKAVIEGITQVFIGLDIPAHAVEVVVHEIPKSHWGVGGQPASEWALADRPPGAGVGTGGGRQRTSRRRGADISIGRDGRDCAPVRVGLCPTGVAVRRLGRPPGSHRCDRHSTCHAKEEETHVSLSCRCLHRRAHRRCVRDADRRHAG